jgi:hypothetical protein
MVGQYLKASLAYLSDGIRLASWAMVGLVITTLGLLLFLGVMALKVNPAYTWGFLAVLPLAVVDVVVYRKVTAMRLRNRLAAEWGKETNRKRAFATIANLHQFRKAGLGESIDPIDDQT